MLPPGSPRMLFNSYVFIFAFLPAVLFGYEAVARTLGRRQAIAWVALCSLFFYGWWNPIYLLLLLASVVANYGLGRVQEKAIEESGPSKRILIGTVVLNLGLLGYYKYSNFLAETVAWAIGSQWELPPVVLPLAISFYTFQQIAYAVDVYEQKVEGNAFFDYLLFVTFFPQLIAGPIVHHKDILSQFQVATRHMRARAVPLGLSIFAVGLFKKVVLADSVAPMATQAFGHVADGGEPGMLYAWVGSLAYTMQLYFDFSGYSDMAIGLGRLFHIRLPQNFDSPYKSRNISEFWRRWHMTLSTFLRDYLYIPLGGNRAGNFMRYRNLMLTMVLGGLWHGAGWTFIFWGFLHGSYLMVHHAYRAAVSDKAWSDAPPLRVAYWLLTFLAVVVGWVFFRAADFPSAVRMLEGMVGMHGLGAPVFRKDQVAMLAVLLAISFFGANTQQIFGRYQPTLDYVGGRIRTSMGVRPAWGLVMGALFGVALLGLSAVSEFLYYQF